MTWNFPELKLNMLIMESIVVVIQSLSRVWLFATPWTAAHQASLSFTTSWSLLRLMFIESVMLSHSLSPTISPSATLFSSCPQSSPAWSHDILYFPIPWTSHNMNKYFNFLSASPLLWRDASCIVLFSIYMLGLGILWELNKYLNV